VVDFIAECSNRIDSAYGSGSSQGSSEDGSCGSVDWHKRFEAFFRARHDGEGAKACLLWRDALEISAEDTPT
jgi:hypothetical protein